MKVYRMILSCLLMVVFVLVAVNAHAHKTISVSNADKLLKVINKLKSGSIVYLKSKSYVLNDTLRITTSNVSIIGEPGTKLSLANNVNKPVIAIGSQEAVPTFTTVNVTISDIEIDGNKDNQSSEIQADKPWIRNNGIDVRAVKRLTIQNVVSRNSRSGGLVISNKCSDIYVMNSEFDNNFFDGIAYYDSKRIYTQNSSIKNNNGAGISLDVDISDSIFSNCILDSNKDVGIFIRFANELRFNNCVIKNSGSYAVFLGHNEEDKGVHDLMFSGCQLLNNVGGVLMSSVNDTQSSHNSVVGCVFRANEQAGRLNIKTEGSQVYETANIMM